MFFAFLYLLRYYTEGAFTVPPFMDPLKYLGQITPKHTGTSASCPNRYPFDRVYMEGKKQTPLNNFDQYLSMNDRYLQPHEVDKTIFESDKKLQKSYNTLITSNVELDYNSMERDGLGILYFPHLAEVQYCVILRKAPAFPHNILSYFSENLLR